MRAEAAGDPGPWRQLGRASEECGEPLAAPPSVSVRSKIVEDDCAVGVRLSDGSEERADFVVSNANGHATIFDMLGGHYTSPAITSFYGAPQDRIEMGIHVSLGLARALPAEPHAIVLPLDKPVSIANETRQRLYVEPLHSTQALPLRASRR